MLKEAIGKLVQATDLGIGRLIDGILAHGHASDPIAMPLVAVCGAPRTGSTLTYQILSQAFDTFFISNLQNVLFRSPLLGWMLVRRLKPPYVSDFKSTGGFIEGLNGPAEAMRFWRYWCDHQLYEQPPKPKPSRLRRWGKALNAIHARTGQPLLGGYLPHAFYIDHLRELFPKRLFVRMDRDLLDAAYSGLLRWRETEPNSAAARASYIYGTRPIEAIGTWTPHEYVARQQYFTAKRLDSRERENPNEFVHAEYAAVCGDPHRFVEQVAERMQRAGISAGRRMDVTLPDSFHPRSRARDQDEDTRTIAVALDRLVAEYGPTLAPYRGAAGD